eukprot:TRINITY_DN75_c4_g2_i1.p1 TRINITY_DN75_c4_g2~~TRINITY_DN75_c4_g2_i1.p1  ORF type:complete len:429 (-),score=69.88 TRINITY_DN75_c4_g2_i1:156-1442(-)
MYSSIVSFEEEGFALPQNLKRPLSRSLLRLSTNDIRGERAQGAGKLYYPQLEYTVDFTLEGDRLRDQILPIVKELIPPWKSLDTSKFEIKMCAGGLTNKLYRVSANVGKKAQRVLLRVYGELTEGVIDRESEIVIWQRLHKAKLGPRFYGTFANGCVYGYVEGRPLNVFDLQEPKVITMVAEHIAQLHATVVIPDFDNTPKLWNAIDKWVELVPLDFSYVHNKEHLAAFEKLGLNLAAEAKSLKAALDQLDSPSVFCHNDANPNNIIYHEKSNSMMLIDHEYASYNYRGYELGNHFNEYTGYDLVWENYPKKEAQYAFLRRYLAVYATLWNRSPHLSSESSPAASDFEENDLSDDTSVHVVASEDDVTEEQIHQLYKEANQYSLASHLFWGAWGLAQSRASEIEFDYFGYALKRFTIYFDNKAAFLAL